MCIGLPMRVIECGGGRARVLGRGRFEDIDTRLVDPAACEPGRWLLVFQGAAREPLSAERAAEIDATLDLLEAALAGDGAAAGSAASFALPSAMTADQLRHLSGQAATETTP